MKHGTSLASAVMGALLIPGLGSVAAWAGPEGGSVSSGAAGIAVSGTATTVTQTSERAVLDWRSFNLNHDESTRFVQPSAGSVAVNRIHDASPTRIDGALSANGHLVLVNPNGVLFGAGARVDVQGLVASTAGPSDADARAWAEGRRDDLPLSVAGTVGATVQNQGTIVAGGTAGEAGLVGFVAPRVINDGVIQARKGTVILASGDTATLDLHGDGLVSLAVSDAERAQLAANHGLIEADGGTVLMSAAAARSVADGVISMTGVIQARSVEQKNGRIILSAEGSNAVAGNIATDKGQKTRGSTVMVSGVLDASGRDSGQKGGQITVTGDQVALTGTAFLDASGHTGQSGTTGGKAKSAHRRDAAGEGSAGGEILIGGDYLGQGSVPTAKDLYVEQGALILNDATHSGDAGRTIFWSDRDTSFYGMVFSRVLGGRGTDTNGSAILTSGARGEGGFVETSGHRRLDAGGFVDLTAASGSRGTYFLDPTDITIYGNIDPNFVSTDGTSINLASSLKLWLDASDTSKVNLTYSMDALGGATVTGTSGSMTLTTSSNVASSLAIGARIRLGAAGIVAVASTLGADTYTITGISGTTITLSSALTTNYTSSALYRGLVSQLADKSTIANDFVQTAESKMSLWISNGENGKGTLRFDGNNDNLSRAVIDTNTTNTSLFLVSKPASGMINGATFKNGDSNTGYGVGYGGTYYANAYGSNGNHLIYLLEQISWNNSTANYGTNTNILSSIIGTSSIVNSVNGAGILTINQLPNTPANYTYLGGYELPDPRFAPVSIPETLFYSSALSTNARNLVEQYQSAKWNVALTPPGTGATEVVKATAADGYSAFTTRYLERLSQTADISLQATNNINLDFKSDTLNLATAGRSLTLTAGNQITTASSGAITTNNGNVTLNGTNGILFNHAFTLNAGTAAIALASTNAPITASGAITLGSNTTLNAGTGTITANAITMNANKNLTLTADDLALGGNLSGTGTLTLQPSSYSVTARINDGTGNFNLNAAELGRIQPGWNNINIGNASNGAYMYIGASSWNAPTTFRAYYEIVNGAVSSSAPLTFNSAPQLNNNITTSGQNVAFNGGVIFSGDSIVGTNGGNVAINGGASSAFGGYNRNAAINTGGGNLTISGSLSDYYASSTDGLTFNAGSGTIAFGNTVNTTAAITANAGNFTFNGVWGTSTALGNVSLTSPTSFTMPNLAATGNVTLNAGTGTITTGSIAAGSGNLTLTADDLVLGGNVSGTGTLTLQPYSTSRVVRVNGGAGDFNIDSVEIARLADGWNNIVIGNGVFAPSQAMYIGTTAWTDPVVFLTGNTQSVGSLSGMGNASFTFNNGGLLSLTGGTIATAGGSVSIANGAIPIGTTTINTNGGQFSSGAIYYNAGVALNVNSSGGSQNFNNVITSTHSASSLNLNAGAGAINFGGALDGRYSLTANAGSYTFNGAWGNSTALGNVSLTSANTGFSLPNLTSTGNVTLNAGTGTIFTGRIGTGAGNLTLAGDDLVIGNILSGSGTLTLKPNNLTLAVRVNGGTGGFNLDTTEIGYFQDGWSNIVIGAQAGGGVPNGLAYTVGASTWYDPVVFLSESGGTVSGTITALDNASVSIASRSGNSGNVINADINANAGFGLYGIAFTGGMRTISTNNGNITFSGNGNPTLLNANLNLSAGSGTITFNGDVAGSGSVTATGGTIVSNYSLGQYSALGNISLTSTNSMALPTIRASSIFAQTTGATSDITLPSGNILTATGTGNALTLVAGRNFINNAGASALSLTNAGAKRWLVYSTSPADTMGEETLASGFSRYNCAYAAAGTCAGGMINVPASGNGLLYSTSPTLVATAAGQNVTYGDAATLSGYGYTLSGYNGGDAMADGITGILNGSSLYAPGGDVGSYGISYASGTLTSNLGYTIAYADNASAIVVTPRTLTAGLTGSVVRTYDATTAATLTTGNYTLSNRYGSDAVMLNNPTSGVYDTKNVGTGKLVSVSGLTLGGAKAGNYVLGSTNASGMVGSITAYTLNAGLAGSVSKTYDGTDAATLAAANYTLTSVLGSDAVTLTHPTAGLYADRNAGSGKTVSVGGLALMGADAGDYALAATTASAALGTILTKGLTVAADAGQHKTYGDVDGALTYSYSGLAAGDASAAFSGALARALGQDAGSYAIGQDTLAAIGNYHIGNFTGTGFTIDKATLTLTAPSASRIYGDTNPVFDYADATVTGYRNGESGAVLDSLAFAVAPSANATAGAGSQHAITVAAFADNNYTLGGTSAGTLTIDRAELLVRPDDRTRAAGTANPAFAATVTGYRNGETTSVVGGIAFATPATVASPAGLYDIFANGGTAANYRFTYSPGILTVTGTVPMPPAMSEINLPAVHAARIEDLPTTVDQGRILIQLDAHALHTPSNASLPLVIGQSTSAAASKSKGALHDWENEVEEADDEKPVYELRQLAGKDDTPSKNNDFLLIRYTPQLKRILGIKTLSQQ